MVLSDLNGCSILPVAVTSLAVNKPNPPLIEGVEPLYCRAPVTCKVVNWQLLELLSNGMFAVEELVNESVIPEPVILIFVTEQFVVVGNDIAVPSW